MQDVKCHTSSDTKFHTIFAVTESVILIRIEELSYFGNFFDFGNSLDDTIQLIVRIITNKDHLQEFMDHLKICEMAHLLS